MCASVTFFIMTWGFLTAYGADPVYGDSAIYIPFAMMHQYLLVVNNDIWFRDCVLDLLRLWVQCWP